MKMIDWFLIKDYLKIPISTDIAFVVDEVKSYHHAWASIRIKCYDVIKYLNTNHVRAELYKPFKRYKVVIFVKTSSKASLKKAEKLHKKGVHIIYNAYCDHLTDATRDDEERRNTLRLIELSDEIIVCTKEQYNQFIQFHDKVQLVFESVPDTFFEFKKLHSKKDKPVLVYCGYSHKAKDTLTIKNVLKKLIANNRCELLYICDKDPELKELDYKFIQYDQKKIFKQLMNGDVAIAPRKMEGIEKLSHSFTKVALTGAIGLPTIASPIPSYIGTPVTLCTSDEDWEDILIRYIDNHNYRSEQGMKLREYIQDNYSLNVIGAKYRDIFEAYL